MSILHKLKKIVPSFSKKSTTLQNLISLEAVGGASWSARNYPSLVREGYLKNVVAYRCIRMIAEASASVPLELHRHDGALCNSGLQALLAIPNGDQSGASFFEEVFGYLQASGNAFIEAVRIEGEVRELYALRPDRIKIHESSDGWPAAYEYDVAGKKRIISRQDDGFMPVLHVKLFHPLSDHNGMAPLSAAANAVDIHNAACEWNKALLDNAARPSGALIYKGQDGNDALSADQLEILKAELLQGWQGKSRAGRPMVLDGGLDWKQMSLTPTDMDFIEAKHSAARDIALAFGVPPQLLGIPGDNTYSNYREANLAFWRQTILPLVGKMAAALSGWLCEEASSTRIAYDVSKVDALSPERTQRLNLIASADFLSDQEKRISLGFPAQGGSS